MLIDEYRDKYYKIFKRAPSVILTFVQLSAAPVYFDVYECIFVDEVVSITKKYGIKTRGIVGYFF